MAKKRYNVDKQEEVVTPADLGIVDDEISLLEDTEQLDTLVEVPTLEEAEQLDTLELIDTPEQDKVSSIAELMDRAQLDPRVDTNLLDVELEDLSVIDEPMVAVSDISSIIKRDDLALLEKIELVSNSIGGVAGSVIKSILALYVLGSKTATRQPDPMNREQRALVRYFIRLATQTNPEEFNQAMKYINWVYKQLTDEKVLDKEQLTLVRGVSPLDPTNSSIFTAGKDDKELITFVYLITVIDVKANASTPAEKSRKIDIGKTTASTLLTEEIVTKINNFYSL